MDLNQLVFTKRRFKSDTILYNDYLLGVVGGKNHRAAEYIMLKINRDTVVVNPLDHIFDFKNIPISIEVTFVPFEYPNPGDNILIAYGPDLNSTGKPCFMNPLKNSIQLKGQNINNDSPGSRLGIALKRSKSNIWAFGGYQSPKKTNSTTDSYFFLFNGTSNHWVDKTELAIKANIPNLVYHTMENINDEYLIIIGGGTYDSQGILVDKPFDKAYKFDLNQETWTTVSLANCPTNTKIGHTTTIVNGNLVVIGGTDNQEESKLNIYSDIISIDPTNLKCTNINLKYENGKSTSIQTAFHSTSNIDGILLINSGVREPDYENQEIYIDTSTWSRKFRFKDLELTPNFDSIAPSSQPKSNTNTIIYCVVGVGLLLISAILLYYIFVIKRRKKRELNDIQTLTEKANSQGPAVEWISSDLNTVQLNNEAVFTLDDKATSRMKTEADREVDLHQLNSLNLAYKNNSSSKQDASNNIQEFSTTLTNSTLVNNTKIDDDYNTLTSTDILKD